MCGEAGPALEISLGVHLIEAAGHGALLEVIELVELLTDEAGRLALVGAPGRQAAGSRPHCLIPFGGEVDLDAGSVAEAGGGLAGIDLLGYVVGLGLDHILDAVGAGSIFVASLAVGDPPVAGGCAGAADGAACRHGFAGTKLEYVSKSYLIQASF